MHPLIGLSLGGDTLTPFDDVSVGRGSLGTPVWGPSQLLRDLELRLGLNSLTSNQAVRTARWAARMAVLADGRDWFYSASFALDPLGTAAVVLALRDALIAADWDGRAIPDGGPRLDAIAQLEALPVPILPCGEVDRVATVARVLEGHPCRVYAQVTLAEGREQWPRGWRRVFEALQLGGTVFARLRTTTATALPGASPDTDLGKLQAAFASGKARLSSPLRGDGTLVLLTGETSLEAACAAVAVLAGEEPTQCVVVRERDATALDYALATQGMPTQGLQSASPWRAALQVLPLALELAFEPKDPYRVLELLSLPAGPFTGRVGRSLLRALARSPGIGGRAWEEAKQKLPEPQAVPLQQVAQWLEAPGADPIEGAAKPVLLEVIARVRAWLSSRIAVAPQDSTLHLAAHQCDALAEALQTDSRDTFDLVLVRRLSEFVMDAGAQIDIAPEYAGRIAHVSSAQALWVPRQTVLWWSFTQSYERSASLPWRRRESAALKRAGVEFPRVELALSERADGHRRVLQAATRRLILVSPRCVEGHTLAPHPLWDEIVARLQLAEAARARITCSAAQLLSNGPTSTPLVAVRREGVEPLALPAAHTEWSVHLSGPPDFSRHSAASLNALLGCPLQWALSYQAGLSTESAGLPAQHLLSGTLGHRLIEELYEKGAFNNLEQEVEALRAQAEREIDELFEREGAPLLRAGKAHERDQLRRQLVDAACALLQALRDNGLRLVGVEEGFVVPWQASELAGRWDLLATTDDGKRVVIDMKWGQARYAKDLQSGSALQLATYTYALEAQQSDTVAAAYFSLSERKLFGHVAPGFEVLDEIAGPSLGETWRRIENTAPLVQQQVSRGRLPVCGVSRSRPLLDQLGITEVDKGEYFELGGSRACDYCRFDAVCGRRWETSP